MWQYLSHYQKHRLKYQIAQFHEIEQFDTLNDAFDSAISIATQGDTILFSPACASFDQYLNFEERGKHFISLVNEYRKNII